MQTSGAALAGAVWAALAQVLDPELGEPVTDLGLVTLVELRPGDGCREAHAVIELRPPSGGCPPYLAWVIRSALQEAAESTPGVGSVEVRLPDGPEPGAGAAVDFRRRAHAAAQLRLTAALVDGGLAPEEVPLLTLADAARRAPRQVEAVRRHRRALELPVDEGAAALVDELGRPVPPTELGGWRRRAEAAAVTIRGDAVGCRERSRRYSRGGVG
jgi:metal-sulfur cluster biosynthetic enzyme